MNKTFSLFITEDDEITVNLPMDQEHLTALQSAFYLFAYRLLDEDERVLDLADELIEEYNNQQLGSVN